jgi:hypothetical protein
MRLWSIHPKYLDSIGLIALWREALLAQKVLLGQTVGYKNHPQLNRFRSTPDPVATIGQYLYFVYYEAFNYRGFNFDFSKIQNYQGELIQIDVSDSQLNYEFQHLQNKLTTRNIEKFHDNLLYSSLHNELVDTHKIFNKITGNIADWEIVSSQNK